VPVILFLALIIEVFVVFFALSKYISKIKFRKVESFLIVGCIAIFVLLAKILIPIHGIAAIVANILIILVLSFASYRKNKNMQLSLFYGAITVIIFVFVGFTAGVAMQFIFEPITREFVLNELIPFSIYYTAIVVLVCLISKWLGDFLHKKIKTFDDELKKQFANYMLIGTAITLALFFSIVFLRTLSIDAAILNLINALFLAVYFISLVLAISAFTENILKESEIKRKNEMLSNLQTYTENVEGMVSIVSELRQFRHDHKNLLLGFKDLVANKDIDGIHSYLQRYQSAFDDSTIALDLQLDKLQHIKRPELKSILASKLIYAQHLKIDVHIEVSDDINGIDDGYVVDLCRIMGILLDNALEACQTVENPILKFMAAVKNRGALFVVKNTRPSPMPSISQMYKEGFTTKENGRGMGLYIASLICDKNIEMSLQSHAQDENDFTQEFFVELVI